MKREEILESWDVDSVVDRTEVSNELVKIPRLHNKYIRWFSDERLQLRALEAEMKRLRLEKSAFFQDGPCEVTRAKGWRYPANKGLILRGEVPTYVEADEDVQKLQWRIDVQKEKVDILDGILRSLKDRSFWLRTVVDFERFRSGA